MAKSSYDELKRLGWVSSYTRQVLLSRFVLRALNELALDHVADPESKLLVLMRLVLSVEAKRVGPDLRVFAPYTPTDRPEVYSLKQKGASTIEVSVGTKSSDRGFVTQLNTDSISGAHRNSWPHAGFALRDAFDLLAFELGNVSKGVNLNNKGVADLRCDLLLSQPLWPNTKRSAKPQEFEKPQKFEKPEFEFWARFYQSKLEGRAIDQGILTNIAKIPDLDWERGPVQIASLIEEIVAQYLSKTAPLAEDVRFNGATSKFHVVPLPMENSALISAMILRTEDCIGDSLLGANGLSESSSGIRKLKRTHSKYGNDPQQVELAYTSVAISNRRQIEKTGELAKSEDNLALLEAVEEGALAVRAHHPEVAKNRKTIAKQRL